MADKNPPGTGRIEELLRSLIHHTADIVAVLEEDRSIRYLNPAVERVLGYRPDELVGRGIFEFIHPDDVELAKRFCAGHLESPGISPPLELRLRRKDRTWCDVEATVNNLLEDDSVRGIVTVSRDVGERKRAEGQVRFQARLLDAVGQAVIATDMRGDITYWGRYAEELYGWSAREMVGRSAAEIMVSDNQRDHAEEIVAELRAGRSWSGEFLVRRKDRATFPALVTNSPVYDDRRNLIGMIGVSTSIREIKEAEQALRQSERKFRTQYQGFPIPTYSWKRARGDFVLIDFNEAAREITHGGISGFLGRKASEMYSDMPRVLERFSRCFHERTTIKEEMCWRMGTDGEVRDLVVSFVFAPPDLVMVHAEDVTERKRAEAALRESEEWFRRLHHATFEGIFIHDGEKILAANEALAAMSGYGVEELVGSPGLSFVTPESRQVVARHIMQGSGKPYEVVGIRKDGTLLDLEVRGREFVYRDLPARMVSVRDVTERKRAAEALRSTQEILMGIMDNAPLPIYTVSEEGRLGLSNQFFANFVGMATPEEVDGSLLEEVFTDEEARQFREINDTVIETGAPSVDEEWAETPDGRHYFRTVKFPLRDPDGAVSGIGGISINVTGRKRAEEALRESEALAQRQLAELQTVYDTSPVGLAFVDTGLRFVMVNELLAEFNGFPVEEHLGKTLAELLPAELAAEIEPLYRGVIESGEPVTEMEIRSETRARPGVLRDWLVSFHPVRGSAGEVLGVNALVQDVTERKRTGERLRVLADASRAFTEAGTEYRPLLDVVARTVSESFGDVCGVWLVSEDGRMLDPAALHHPDPEATAVIRVLRELSIPFGEGITGTVAQTGEPWIIPEVDPERFQAMVYRDHREHVGRLGVRSLLVVPLCARGEMIGCLVLARVRPGEPYAEDDRRFAWDLADRAALAIDNALLYRAAGREIAERTRAEKALEASERRLSLIYHNTTDVLYLLAVEQDGVYRFVSANDAFLSVTGLKREQVEGQRIEKVLPPAARDLVRSKYEEALRENKTVRWEEVSEYPAGLRYGDVRVTPMRDESTGQNFLVGSVHDITGLRESEERFRTLTDAALEALAISERVDGEGRILGVNRAFTEVFGYELEEFSRRGYRDIIAPESRATVEKNIASGFSGTYEAVGQRKDGTRIELEIRGKTAVFQGRRVRISALRDITERKRAEDRLRVLADASHAFAQEATEYHDLVEIVARTVAEDFGDLCGVVMLADDRQTIEAVAYHHQDPEVRGAFREMVRIPMRPGEGFVGRLVQTGEPIFVPEIAPEQLNARLEPQHRPYVERMGIRGLIAVPLRVRGEARGALFLARTRMHEPYVEVDLKLAEDLAERAALALEGALSYRTAQKEISEREAAEDRLRESEEWFRALAYNAYDLNVVLDAEGVVTYVNPAVERLLGYGLEELTGRRYLGYVHPDDRGEAESLFAEIRSKSGVHEPFEFRMPHRDGSWRYLECAVNNMLDDPTVRGVVINQRDITERKQMEERLEYQAFHDMLTGLPNRALFLDRVEQALSRAQRSGGRLAVLFLDLDGFKTVNDSLGHEAGDQLLREAAERLRMRLRPKDTIARLGGDEFVVLLEDVPEPGDVVRVIDRLLEGIRSPFALLEREVYISVSIGISLSAAGRGLPEDLIRQADTAMYGAKQRAGNSYQVFDPGMHTRILRRLEVESELRRAVEREEFVLHYQPIVDLRSGKVTGAEALVRWRHPERGLIQPGRFIPIAEETGLIVPLGRWVLGEACRQASEWISGHDGLSPLLVSVNLSLKQLRQNDLCEEVARALRETGLDPSALSLEITESVAIDDDESAVPTLRELKDLGVGLAMDDFGAGHSSLTYLIKHLRMDTLKIDRAFTAELLHDPEHGVVLSGIVGFARALGLKVVAEGIESAEQLQLVRELGCDLGQGYFLTRPVPSEKMPALLSRTFLP